MSDKDDNTGDRQEHILTRVGEPYRFKKGVSGNPKGAPKGYKRASTILKELLSAVDENNGTKLEQLMHTMINKGLEGDLYAIKEVLDRIEGKAIATTVEISASDVKNFADPAVEMALEVTAKHEREEV